MSELLVFLKVVGLFFGLVYSCPVIIGGAIQKDHVTQAQAGLWAAGWTVFITLQWFIHT